MAEYRIGDVSYHLREYQDLSWLKQFGHVFSVIDETGSGCICFGVEKDGQKYFYKIAGAKTMEAELSEEEAIKLLKKAAMIYRDLKDPHLIRILDTFEYKEFYTAVFAWAEGECLFDHWNFDRYRADPDLQTPMQRFRQLPLERINAVIDDMISFFRHFTEKGYTAVDFYDSSIIYDFAEDRAVFCDIDLFEKGTIINTAGPDYPGTKRYKAPEENEAGAVIDEVTNEFTLAALITDFLSMPEKEEIRQRYELGMYIPPKAETFRGTEKQYSVLQKAVSYKREERYPSMAAFIDAYQRGGMKND